MLHIEVTIRSTRIAFQLELEPAEYTEVMLADLEELDDLKLKALDYIKAKKNWVSRAYNKRVKAKSFVKVIWCGKLSNH